jgi:hypothetical protein
MADFLMSDLGGPADRSIVRCLMADFLMADFGVLLIVLLPSDSCSFVY